METSNRIILDTCLLTNVQVPAKQCLLFRLLVIIFAFLIVQFATIFQTWMTVHFYEGLCTSVGRVHANIVLIGDPKQLDSVTKSKWSEKLGFKTSWFEQLFNLPLYSPHTETGEFNKMYITQLLQNYRSHPAILKVPSQLFYDKKLKAMVSPGMSVAYKFSFFTRTWKFV